MKAAILNDALVVINLIVWDETCVAPVGTTAVMLPNDYYVSIGFVYNPVTNTFTDPNAGA